MPVVSESESDEDDDALQYDEMDLALSGKMPCPASAGGGLDGYQRERLRHADCEALSRRYWDAVLGMSSAVDIETVGVRLGVGTKVSGPLWEVSRAATSHNLPMVLRHFTDPRLRLCVCPPCNGSVAHDDDDSDECAVKAMPCALIMHVCLVRLA